MNIDDVGPVTVIEDRYCGTYIGWHLNRDGKYVAWHCSEDQVPDAPFRDDNSASDFWAWVKEIGFVVGVGDTEEAARADLLREIEANPDYDPAKLPRYLGDWRP